MVWQWTAVFAAAVVPLGAASVVLARSGDRLATLTRLDGMFVGLALVAAVTSLPEIVTIGAAAATGADGLALGGLFGSSMANMAILALVDLLHRGRFWPEITLGNARTAAVAIGLTALAIVGALATPAPTIGRVGLDGVAIIGAYLAAAAWIHRSPSPGPSPAAGVPERGGPPATDRVALGPRRWIDAGDDDGVARVAVRFGVAAAVIVVTGPVVARAADGIADTTGLGATFVGVVLLAFATSLPELIVSLTAVRIGAYDVAVGNLFGSNAFNMVVILPADLLRSGPLLAAAPRSAIVAGAAAIGLMAMALAAIVHEERTRAQRLEPDAVALLLAYVIALAVVRVT